MSIRNRVDTFGRCIDTFIECNNQCIHITNKSYVLCKVCEKIKHQYGAEPNTGLIYYSVNLAGRIYCQGCWEKNMCLKCKTVIYSNSILRQPQTLKTDVDKIHQLFDKLNCTDLIGFIYVFVIAYVPPIRYKPDSMAKDVLYINYGQDVFNMLISMVKVEVYNINKKCNSVEKYNILDDMAVRKFKRINYSVLLGSIYRRIRTEDPNVNELYSHALYSLGAVLLYIVYRYSIRRIPMHRIPNIFKYIKSMCS